MKHPNIVGFRELFENEENYFLVLDFIDGGDLLDILKKRETFSEEVKFLKFFTFPKLSIF